MTLSQPPECLKRRSVEPVFRGPPVSNDGTHIIYHVGVVPETSLSGPIICQGSARTVAREESLNCESRRR